jgi:hypothetical protein
MTMPHVFARIAPNLLAILELLLVSVVCLLIFLSQARRRLAAQPRTLRSIERALGRLARRKRLAVVVIGAGVVILRVALIPVLGVPEPRWHDEYSFLLAADTFAHGRITNPTHPMWAHFESFHIIWHPTYMSMYPPGQGLILAAGQLLGHPWIGQLLATGAMCAAICWMLQAWIPPQWAFFGASLVALRIGLLSYWMNSYFCGSLAALGGALVLGAFPRIKKKATLGNALAMGFGAAILANTRPYEGFVFCLPVAVAMIAWLATQKKFPVTIMLRRVVFPLCVVLGMAGLATGYYFWKVTNSPFTMPYQVNRTTYAVAPYFVWQKAHPVPEYRYDVMRRFYTGFEIQDYELGRTPLGLLKRLLGKIPQPWLLYCGPIFTLPLLAFPCILRDRKMRFPLFVGAVVVIGIVLEVWTSAHYIAPATCLFFLFLIQCMRHLRHWRWKDRPIGAALVRAVPLLCVAMILLRVSAVATGTRIEPEWPRGNLERAAMLTQLRSTPGTHLVIVRYAPDHGPNEEWVYNRADIDSAKVVWARDMGDQNQELLNYFKGRHVWIVYPDVAKPELQAYAAN